MRCACGFENNRAARFCRECGAVLDVGTPAMDPSSLPSAATPAPAQKFPLRVLRVAIAAVLAIAGVAGGAYVWSKRSPTTEKPDNSGLFSMPESGKYGFVDSKGAMIIAAQFDGAREFSDGLAAIRVGEKYGFINTKGEIVISPQFDEASDFHYGRAIIAFHDTPMTARYGAIDATGKSVGTATFSFIRDFTGEFASLSTLDHRSGFLNRRGEAVLVGKFEALDNYREGLAAARSGNNWGYIDEKGEWAIPPQFEEAFEFAEGLAPVKAGGNFGFIDRSGKFKINPQFESVSGFSEGYAGVWRRAVRTDSNFIFGDPPAIVVGIINSDGQLRKLAFTADLVFGFHDGLALIHTDSGFGFIDQTGKIVLRPEFERAGDFRNGLASVTLLGRAAYITTTGSFVIDPFLGTSRRAVQEALPPDSNLILQRAYRKLHKDFDGEWVGVSENVSGATLTIAGCNECGMYGGAILLKRGWRQDMDARLIVHKLVLVCRITGMIDDGKRSSVCHRDSIELHFDSASATLTGIVVDATEGVAATLFKRPL